MIFPVYPILMKKKRGGRCIEAFFLKKLIISDIIGITIRLKPEGAEYINAKY